MPAHVGDIQPRTGFAFTKRDRLLGRAEFLAAQARGRRVHATHFVLVMCDRSDDGPARIGITASRKVANSVMRNRIRRRIREVFRLNRAAFPTGHDCVVIVREAVPDLSLASIRDEMLQALKRPARSGRSAGAANRAKNTDERR